MATQAAHNLGIKPVERKDLKDYFPRANAHYPGYIRMAVFREKLKATMQVAMDETRIRENLPQQSFSFYACNGSVFKNILLLCIDQQDWRPANLMGNFSKQMRDKAKASLAAATVKPATQIATGKVIEKGVGKMAKGVDYLVKNDKVSPKVGKVLSAAVTTYEPLNKWVSINASETGFGMMVGRGIQYAGEKMSPNTETIEVSLNTEETRGLLMKTGMSEGLANGIMEGVDFLSDWVPVAAVTKMAESAVANGVMSYKYWRMAEEAEKSQQYFDEQWNDITRKLKADLSADIKSLTEEEINELYKMLNS